jgi:hypothetical protein
MGQALWDSLMFIQYKDVEYWEKDKNAQNQNKV